MNGLLRSEYTKTMYQVKFLSLEGTSGRLQLREVMSVVEHLHARMQGALCMRLRVA